MKRVYLYFLPFLFSCANIQAPTGGPKDDTPPKMLSSTPEDRTLNFKGRDVVLKFNENILATNLQEKLQITPSIEFPYKVKLKRKEVWVHFDKDFEPNTTYTLNFRDAIKDETEQNKASNIVISFSTGAYLDSISFSGRVLDLKTNQPIENAMVELYNDKDTFGIKSHKPLYFSQTDKSGSFEFKNLKNNFYTVYAITDKNSDLMYQEGEKIGWQKNANLTKNVNGLDLQLFSQDTKAPNITGTTGMDTKYEIRFNEGVVVDKLIYMSDSTQNVFYSQKETGRSLYIYNTLNKADSIPMQISVKDSTGNTSSQKIKIAFDKKTRSKDRFQVKFEPTDRKVDPGMLSVKMMFSKPVITFNKKSMIIDVDTTKLNLPDSSYIWNKSRTELTINRKIKKCDTISIYTFKETFISAEKDSLEGQKIKLTILKEEDYGVISGGINTKEINYIIELVDVSNKVVGKLNSPKKIKFANIKPGEYSLRVIIDSNKNGKWDSGDAEKNLDPEKIIYYKDKIKLKANWEIENINFKF